MHPDVRRLYVYHALNGVTLSFITSELYINALLLRSHVDMGRFGLVLGLGMIGPALASLVASPLVAAWKIERPVAGGFSLLRAALAFLFLLPLRYCHTPDAIFYSYACLYVVFMSSGYIANNALMALYRRHIPAASMGKHSSAMLVVWQAPASLLGIGYGAWLDRHSASDDDYLRALVVLLVVAAVAQLAAMAVLRNLGREAAGRAAAQPAAPNAASPAAEPAAPAREKVRWADLSRPFADPAFRPLLIVTAMLCLLQAGANSFVFPCLTQIEGWGKRDYATVNGAMGLLNFALVPIWGAVTDKMGGRNVLLYSTLGMAAGIGCLAVGGTAMVWAFALLNWLCMGGLFGSASSVANRYLMLQQSDHSRTSIYVAVLGFVGGVTGFIGAAGGGRLLEWFAGWNTSGDPARPFHLLFLTAAAGLLLVAAVAARLTDGRQNVGARQLAGAFLGQLRAVVARRA